MRPLPHGSLRIWNMRMSRMKPDEVVFVSTIGPLNANWVVTVERGDRYAEMEWRWATDLSVCLVCDETSDKRWVYDLCKHIARHAPNGGYVKPFSPNFGYLWVWNAASLQGHRLEWWRGYKGFPELGVADQPEEFSTYRCDRIEQAFFERIGL